MAFNLQAIPEKEKPLMTESELQAAVLDIAAENQVLAFHCYDSRRSTGKGFPDLVLSGLRHTLFAELKDAVSHLKPDQTTWKYRLIGSGEDYVTWRPKDLASGVIEATIKGLNS
jgi:molybdopterin synthase catalytic subunit